MKFNKYVLCCFFALFAILVVAFAITPLFQSGDSRSMENTIFSETADTEMETIEYVEIETIDMESEMTEVSVETEDTSESATEVESIDTLEVITEVYQSDEDDEALAEAARLIEEHRNDTEYYIDLTYDEKYLLAALLFHEGGSEVPEAQYAIVSVVINRMTTRGMNLYDVVYETNQFSPAPLLTSTIPDASHLEVVEYICQHGPTIPEYVTFFRADRYFSPEEMYVLDYDNYGQTYFSYDPRVKEQVEANNG